MIKKLFVPMLLISSHVFAQNYQAVSQSLDETNQRLRAQNRAPYEAAQEDLRVLREKIQRIEATSTRPPAQIGTDWVARFQELEECGARTNSTECVTRTSRLVRQQLSQQENYLEGLLESAQQVGLDDAAIAELRTNLARTRELNSDTTSQYGRTRIGARVRGVGNRNTADIIEDLRRRISETNTLMTSGRNTFATAIDSSSAALRQELAQTQARVQQARATMAEARQERLDSSLDRTRSAVRDHVNQLAIQRLTFDLAFQDLSQGASQLGITLDEMKETMLGSEEFMNRISNTPVGLYIRNQINSAISDLNPNFCESIRGCNIQSLIAPAGGSRGGSIPIAPPSSSTQDHELNHSSQQD